MGKTGFDTVFALLLLSDLILLGSSRFGPLIRTVAAQGAVLGLLPLMAGRGGVTAHQWLLAAGVLVLKGGVFPMLLQRARREAAVSRETAPPVGFSLSLVAGVSALAFSIWMGFRLPLPADAGSHLVVPAALFTLFCGLFLIMARRKALTQVIGYLTMENGIYAFGATLASGQPFLVELGVLLDVFVAVFVMGIAMFHISREFDHMDTDRMAQLGDWPLPAPAGAPLPADEEGH